MVDLTALLEQLCSSSIPPGFLSPLSCRILPAVTVSHTSTQTEANFTSPNEGPFIMEIHPLFLITAMTIVLPVLFNNQ